ncbi:uncharacterized protein [Salminus brasiliensis]|uniref:uncharacterized protein n=1 Tax=Salminus brasiliensis TaxID=930266 RepID=UPI003B833EC0
MSSSEDSHASRLRKNPERTCRTIAEVLAGHKRPALRRRPRSSQTERKTRGNVKKPEAQPTPPLRSSARAAPANGPQRLSRSSKAVEPSVPQQTAVCPQRTPKRPQRGRKKTQPVPEKVGGSDLGADGERTSGRLRGRARVVDCSSTATSEEAPQKKAKVRRVRCSKKPVEHRPPTEPSTAPRTRSTLSSSLQLDTPDLPTSVLSTPKGSRRRPSPAFSSTPVGATCLSTVPLDTPVTPDPRRDMSNDHSSPVKRKCLNVTPRKRGRPLKLQAPDKPAAQQRKKRERKVGAAAPVKSRKKKDGSGVDPQNQLADRVRPRFELHDFELLESDKDMSSDLSIELSLQEEPEAINHSLSLQEEEEDEDEEELPSFLQQTNHKPSSIREGLCVWCKLRKYPFWPAMVKSVNHKSKKASIVFIDKLLFDKKRIRKGFTVSLRTLKPFDCEESDRFVNIARESYGDVITWSLDLISDYRIRIGCGSFVGSFIEYFTDDISYPVRRQFPNDASELALPSQQLLSEEPEAEGESAGEPEEEQIKQPNFKKVLPDRSLAARNRANQRLVDFIVKKRGVEGRLKAVICGQEPSKWLEALHSCSHSVVDVYLEDDQQVDKVYRYLEKLCQSADQTSTSLENTDRIPFILDVLLPEAIIYAIAGVDQLSLDKAEEKYRQGPCHSYRERQEFDMMIEQQMKLKAIAGRPSL